MTLSAPESTPNPAGRPNANSANAADPREDPAMRSLYRMSRTAGVGLQDYAAVNVFAVIGILLAVASVLVLIFADVPAMLLLPIAAIVISAIAFVQIQHSNGTQTGRGIALLGILIALGLAGTNVAGHVAGAARDRTDRGAIEQLLNQFHATTQSQKWDEAYAMFDSRFREQVQLETFSRILEAKTVNYFGGPKLKSIELGERVVFETDANGVRFATSLLTLHFDGKHSNGMPLDVEEPAEFRKVDDAWKFHTVMNWFAGVAKPAGGDGAGGGAAGGAAAPGR